MIGRLCLYTGVAFIAAAGLRGLIDLVQADQFDPWTIVLAVGCVLASIGLGLTKSMPWNSIAEKTKDIPSQFQ